MPFLYTTEYRLGRRGRIQRSYTGLQALIAITLDLALGFTYGLVGLVFWLIRACVVSLYRFVAFVLSLPFRATRLLLPRHESRRLAKPAWASFQEL